MTDSILNDPEYKASLARIEEAVKVHHRLLEDWGNNNPDFKDGTQDNTIVVGWVLTIGQVGYNDGREFHDAVVEMPDSLNSFHALGLAEYTYRFMQHQTNNFSMIED